VALSLICLVHRLHLQCQADFKGKGADESDLICSQLISSFTILQGLCLKDQESQKICSRKSTLEVGIAFVNSGKCETCTLIVLSLFSVHAAHH